MAYVASKNLLDVDRILSLSPPNGSQLIQKTGVENVRQILKWHASEQNREYFERWEVLQLLLGVVVAGVLYLGTNASRLMILGCGTMIVLVAFMHWILTPEITWIGRQNDFLAGQAGSRFWALYGLYTVLELLKLMIGVALAAYLFVYKAKPKQAAVEKGANIAAIRGI